MSNSKIIAEHPLAANSDAKNVPSFASSEMCFQMMIEQLNEIVFILDAENCLSYISPAWQQHTGYEVAESLAKPVYQYLHPDDAATCADYFQTPGNSRFEVRVLAKSGQVLWFDVSISSVMDARQVPVRMVALVDVTERVYAAQALKASQERFSLAATASNDGIWDWNLLTNEVYLSPRWKAMLGYADHEIENCYDSWYERIHPDDLETTMAALRECLDGDKSLYQSVHRLRNKQGGWCWILDRGVVMRDEAGRGLRMAGSHADITKLKQVEEQLLERQSELNMLFAMNPDGIVTFNEHGKLSSVNPSFLRMTGFSGAQLMQLSEPEFSAQMTGISFLELPFVLDEGQAYTQVQILPLANNGEDSSLESEKMRVMQVSLCKLAHEHLSKVMYFRDVTIEAQVDRMKSEFLSTAAHELRTPMSSIYGFSELLLNREFDSPITREVLGNIHNQAASLVSMINDLLDLAKIEACVGTDFDFLVQPLDTVVKQAVAEFRVSGDNRDIRLFFDDVRYGANIDGLHIKRALTNIISNAFKYSPDGGEVSISLQTRQGYSGVSEVGVLVRDHGIGMSPGQLAHIYERFWRAGNTRHISGTGLGMSLVKEIMNIHQGHIEIDSLLGVGTTVGLWFKAVEI